MSASAGGVTVVIFLIIIVVAIYYCRKRRNTSNYNLPVHSTSAASPLPPQPLHYGSRNCCLLCHSNPKIGNWDFCGDTCKENATRNTPLLMEVPKGHVTFEMVEGKFRAAWNCPEGRQCPPLKMVYKIVENPNTRAQYDRYKSWHGNECFRYHGTSRTCRIGESGNRYPCWSATCPACCILRTSFQVEVSKQSGAFGQGIYTSSASNKSSKYAPHGVMFLAKVILGNVYNVSSFAEVKSLPRGYNSVVFNRFNDRLNETVVYENAAIRPVYLIIFAP